MKNPKIATILKYYRKLNELTVNDVSEILEKHHNGAAPKTIYGWESGQTQPDADTLMFLCDLYKIDNILQTFGYSDSEDEPGIILSNTEKKLILSYRENKELQPAINKLLL